ncbi:9436_t:CDS:2, partial [Cetraspora pellucida]
MSNTTDEKQETSFDKTFYSHVFKDTNRLKKNAFLRLEDKDQEIFLNLSDLYSKHLINVYNENIPVEGSNEYNLKKDFYDSIKKKCFDRADIRNFENARKEYEEKQRFVKIETENQEIKQANEEMKSNYLDQQKENEKLKQELDEQKELLKQIMAHDDENKDAIEKYFNLNDSKFLS